jgi:hypothetical protein
VVRGPSPDDALTRFAMRQSEHLGGWRAEDARLATAALHQRLGMRALMEGDFAEATARFERLRGLAPERATADLLLMGVLYEHRRGTAPTLAGMDPDLADVRAVERFLAGNDDALHARDEEHRRACVGDACADDSRLMSSETEGGSGNAIAANIARSYGMVPSVLLVIQRATERRSALADHLRLRRRPVTTDSPLAALAHEAWLDHVFAHLLDDGAWAIEADARLARLRAALDADHAIVAHLATERLPEVL